MDNILLDWTLSECVASRRVRYYGRTSTHFNVYLAKTPGTVAGSCLLDDDGSYFITVHDARHIIALTLKTDTPSLPTISNVIQVLNPTASLYNRVINYSDPKCIGEFTIGTPLEVLSWGDFIGIFREYLDQYTVESGIIPRNLTRRILNLFTLNMGSTRRLLQFSWDNDSNFCLVRQVENQQQEHPHRILISLLRFNDNLYITSGDTYTLLLFLTGFQCFGTINWVPIEGIEDIVRQLPLPRPSFLSNPISPAGLVFPWLSLPNLLYEIEGRLFGSIPPIIMHDYKPIQARRISGGPWSPNERQKGRRLVEFFRYTDGATYRFIPELNLDLNSICVSCINFRGTPYITKYDITRLCQYLGLHYPKIDQFCWDDRLKLVFDQIYDLNLLTLIEKLENPPVTQTSHQVALYHEDVRALEDAIRNRKDPPERKCSPEPVLYWGKLILFIEHCSMNVI